MENSRAQSTNPALDTFLLDLASNYAETKKFSPGEIIFSENDPGSTMLLILYGVVRVMKHSAEQGGPVEIAKRGGGEFFGEMSLVEESPRFATVIADTKCEVLEFSKENFERIIREQPALATRVLRSLSKKLRESDSDRIAELEESNRRLDEKNSELTSLNQFLDTIIAQSPTAIVMTRSTGHVVRFNDAAKAMFDIVREREDINIFDMLPGIDFSELPLSENSGWHGELIGKRRIEKFPAFVSISSLVDWEGESFFLIISQDISELKAFNDAMTNVEKFSSAQSTSAELAHDLKNYFGAIVCGLDLVVENLPDDRKIKLRNTIDAMKSSTKKILEFVDKAMVYRQSTATRSKSSIVKLIKNVARFCQAQGRFQGIDIRVKVSDDPPPRIKLNEIHIQSVILNLLVNSAEAFSEVYDRPHKKIAVEVGAIADGAGVRVRVKDNGPGISEDLLPLLFKERRTTKENGHGIGLVSVGKIVQSHGGKISVDSRLGVGTEFTIELPTEGPADA